MSPDEFVTPVSQAQSGPQDNPCPMPPHLDPAAAIPADSLPAAAAQPPRPGEQAPTWEDDLPALARAHLRPGNPRRRRGKRLVLPADQAEPISPQQRLLLLDLWQRSGLPAGDFAPLVGLSKHTLYGWKKRFERQGPAGLLDRPKGGPQGSRLSDLTKRTILMPAAIAVLPDAPPPPLPGPEEQVHRERVRRSIAARTGRSRRAQRRDPASQKEQRQRERQVRAEAAALAQAFQEQGVSTPTIANLLDCPARTLRHWQHEYLAGCRQAQPLGRPHWRVTAEDSRQVIAFLHNHGPWIGLPTLSGAFAGLPAAELRDLLRCYRHLWVGQHPCYGNVLAWHQAGTVWAMDFTKAPHLIDGIYPYVFAVRDLASGWLLAWRPVVDLEAATAQAELALLFTLYGAPLALKSDNGSAFRAASTKRLLKCWQVWPCYSPPGQPSYNGAIEATIGSLKKRTQQAAYLAGHAGVWTTADLDRARESANQVARPRGSHGPTPDELWAARRPPRLDQRESFGAAVRRLEEQYRVEGGLPVEAPLEHYEQAALHRRVLQEVLVERGFLTIARRRLPQTFYGQKVANIT
jgi:transposase InsO family protein